MTNNFRRLSAIASATLVLGATAVVPVFATNKRDDGDDTGTGIGTASAIIYFVLVPLAISGVIALLVLAPGWTKNARNSTRGGFLDDPTLADRQVAQATERTQINH